MNHTETRAAGTRRRGAMRLGLGAAGNLDCTGFASGWDDATNLWGKGDERCSGAHLKLYALVRRSVP